MFHEFQHGPLPKEILNLLVSTMIFECLRIGLDPETGFAVRLLPIDSVTSFKNLLGDCIFLKLKTVTSNTFLSTQEDLLPQAPCLKHLMLARYELSRSRSWMRIANQVCEKLSLKAWEMGLLIGASQTIRRCRCIEIIGTEVMISCEATPLNLSRQKKYPNGITMGSGGQRRSVEMARRW